MIGCTTKTLNFFGDLAMSRSVLALRAGVDRDAAAGVVV
jgi:hypothetical protein